MTAPLESTAHAYLHGAHDEPESVARELVSFGLALVMCTPVGSVIWRRWWK